MYYVGQKVVCVDAGPFRGNGEPSPLVKNRIYTVAGFGSSGEDELVLHEQPGRNDFGFCAHLGYHASRFRPIVERRTDISIFTRMLNPKTAEMDA